MNRLNIYAVAKRYGVHPSTIYQWKVKNWMPQPKKLGGRIFWDESELTKWDAAGYPKPCDQTEEVSR